VNVPAGIPAVKVSDASQTLEAQPAAYDPHDPPQLVPLDANLGGSSEEEMEPLMSRDHWLNMGARLQQEIDSPLLSPTPLEKVQTLTTGE
jgi:hypothetical protein